MAKGRTTTANSYEEERKKQIEDNKKRLQELGIAKVAKCLSDVANMEKQSPAAKPRIRKTPTSPVEVRCSSRARNTVSYKEEFVDDHLRGNRFRSSSSLNTSYLGRPLEEIKVPTYEQRSDTMERAGIFQSELKRKSKYPSCVKSMVRSHVYSCFWLGLPKEFCDSHLSMDCEKWEMVLVDEKGIEYDTIYIPKRTGLSGGWKAFALDHKLDDGDAVVLELTGPARFKVYIFRVSDKWGENWGDVNIAEVKKPCTEDTTDENISEEKIVESKAEGRRTHSLKRVKKSDADNKDADGSASEENDTVRRRTHNPKRLKKTDTDSGDSDGTMLEEKAVVETRVRGRTPNPEGAKKSDARDADIDENTSEEKDVVGDPKATGRRTRKSQRVVKSSTAISASEGDGSLHNLL
ncbi:B3 domain-containing protein Os05g0481400-like isoform X2 [Papaver somniferum]|uniref:B3 domain-containing protein Os05g0481400-like isoform X2 n=1 Tax=Papaver somniferum TaxID=3469 RepID=UPI000E6FE3CF|nr:B3 domain-containing protein Os05g0481400-like isoform X2 [Papaver somniferum]